MIDERANIGNCDISSVLRFALSAGRLIHVSLEVTGSSRIDESLESYSRLAHVPYRSVLPARSGEGTQKQRKKNAERAKPTSEAFRGIRARVIPATLPEEVATSTPLRYSQLLTQPRAVSSTMRICCFAPFLVHLTMWWRAGHNGTEA